MDEREHKEELTIYGKADVMSLFGCESAKALKILKFLFQIGKATKIGKEYYTLKENIETFMKTYSGKEVFI